MVTSKKCFAKYGEPNVEFERKWMVLYRVPAEIREKIPALPARIYLNKDLVGPLQLAFQNIVDRNLGHEIETWDGCFSVRKKRGLSSMSLHCLPKDEPVWTLTGYKNIQDVKVGDKVLSYNAQEKTLEEKTVTNTFVNGQKNIVNVKIRNYNIRCSEDHQIMVMKKTNLPDGEWIQKEKGRGQIRALYNVELTKASDLKRGDHILILKTAKNLQSHSNENLDWFEILGFYVGDGCFHNRKNSNYNYVSFHFPKQDRVREHVKTLLNRHFKVVKENKKCFLIYSKCDYEVFRKYNYKAHEKFIPEEVFEASFEQKLAFIKGLIYSDGYTSKIYNKKDKSKFTVKYCLKTASKKLAMQLKLLCSLVGIKTSNLAYTKPEEKIILGVKCKSKGAYTVTMTDYDNLIKLDADYIYKERQDNATTLKTYGSHCFGYEHIGDEFTLESVLSVEPDGVEDTFDIEVEDNHLFILNGVVVSNSWAIAIDINASTNRLGQTPTMSPELVKCFTDANFEWGGLWSRKDGMHYQLAKI